MTHGPLWCTLRSEANYEPNDASLVAKSVEAAEMKMETEEAVAEFLEVTVSIAISWLGW